MGSEGQNSPNNTSGVERKRPWETFSEKEKRAILSNKKHLKRKEKRDLVNKKLKVIFYNTKTYINNHKILTIVGFIVIIAFLTGSFIVCSNLFRVKNEDLSDNTDPDNIAGPIHKSMDDPLKDMTLKTAPSPEYAYMALIMKLRPILNEGIFDTGLVNLSKLEDNYDAFIKTIDSDYEKTCYYLAMLEIMFNFEEENSSNRAVFLMDRFDERKIKLDETQYYFYLKNRIRYADYKKDEELIRKYNSELTEKYPPDTGYMDLDTGKLIKDKKEIEKIKKDFEKSRGVLENEEH